MWSAAGLPDGGPQTWAEFAEWVPQLASSNPGIAPMTLPDGSNYLDWYFQGMIWTFGGAYSKEWEPTFTSPESLAAGRFSVGSETKWLRIRKVPNATSG
jgi:sn-glycerol 3-phosphate transport system substrate-binding protein